MKLIKLLFTAFALLLCGGIVFAHDFEQDGIYYNILSETDKTVEVTFKGDYYYSYSYEYQGSIIIPESVINADTEYKVVGIGDCSFFQCSGLKSIVIPDAVTSIGDRAFYDCSNLSSLTIGKGVTSIGYSAFEDCDGLTSIVIPDAVTSIGSSAFYGCSKLDTIINYSPLTITKVSKDNGYVGYYADKVINADEQVGVFFFKTIDGIHYLSGYLGNDKNIELPENYNGNSYAIGNSVFSYCDSLSSVIIPDAVTSIGDDAFYRCSNLSSLTIGKGVANIGSSAFQFCFILDTIINYSPLTIAKGSSYNGHVGYYADKVVNADEQVGNFFFKTIDGIHYLCDYLTIDNELQLPENYNGNSYAIGNSVFYNCKSLTNIIIPDSVTSIGSSAFYGCSNLSSLTIGKGVTSIGSYAFQNCSKLDTIINYSPLTITKGSSNNGYVGYYADKVVNADEQVGNFFFKTIDGIHYLSGYLGNDKDLELLENYQGNSYAIGSSVFSNCDSLSSVIIPDSVTSIGNDAFRSCSNLSSLTIGRGVTSIGYSAFEDCDGLTSIVIPDAVTSIGSSAFESCSNLSSLTIGRGVTSIGFSAFNNCDGLTSIVIPDAVTSIGSSAFYNCDGLTSIVIPDAVTNIGERAFYDCDNLSSLTIGKGVTRIGSSAFYGCSKLDTIINYSPLIITEGSTDNGHVGYYADKVVNADEQVGNFFFKTIDGIHYLCDYLTIDNELQLPENYNGNSYAIGNSVFYNCDGLTSIVIPDAVTSIGSSAFESCSNLSSLTIGKGVTSIGERVFYDCDGLTSIIIPDSVTSIGDYAFDSCSKLSSVTIGKGVTSIGSSAFYDCDGLISVNISDIAAWCNIEFWGYYSNPLWYTNHLYMNGEEVTDLVIPNSVTSIGAYAFYDCDGLTSIVIPDAVTSIGGNAFYSCSNLSNVTLGKGVTSIGSSAFSDCLNINKVVNFSTLTIVKGSSDYGGIGKYAECIINVDNVNYELLGDYVYRNVNNQLFYLSAYIGNERKLNLPENFYGRNYDIDNYAFYDCDGLTSIVIPNAVTSIGNDAFYDCDGLTSMVIPDAVTSIGNDAFYGCSNLSSVTIGKGVTSIGASAFADCDSLTSIVIPDAVTSIGDGTFSGCSNLKEITLGSSVEQIGSNFIYVCSALESITVAATMPPVMGELEMAVTDYRSIIVYVPVGSLSAYQSADVWSRFWNIQEFNATGVVTPAISNESIDSPIYNLNGESMMDKSNLPKGIYIQNGKKFIIR